MGKLQLHNLQLHKLQLHNPAQPSRASWLLLRPTLLRKLSICSLRCCSFLLLGSTVTAHLALLCVYS